MSGSNPGNLPQIPGDQDTRPASLDRSGLMRRWVVPTATIGGFVTTGTGSQQRLGVAPATASVAGSMSAADKTKLTNLGHVLLAYVASTDLANGLAVTANTWTTIGTAQTFGVALATSYVAFDVAGNIAGGAGVAVALGSRLLFDGATAHPLGGISNVPAGGFGNALTGAGRRVLASFAAGSHTVAVQVLATVNANVYCRAATNNAIENLTIAVTEYAQ